MKKKIVKWTANVMVLVCLLAAVSVICGFKGETTNCSSEKYTDYEICMADDFDYLAVESSDGDNIYITINVPLNEQTLLPITGSVSTTETMAADVTLNSVDFVFTTESVQLIEGNLITDFNKESNFRDFSVAKTITVPACDTDTTYEFTMQITFDGDVANQSDLSDSKMVNFIINATDDVCPVCGGTRDGNGVIVHNQELHDAEPTTEQPTTEQPTTEQPTTEQPTTEQPTTEQPTTAQPTTAQPTTAQPTTDENKTEFETETIINNGVNGSTGSPNVGERTRAAAYVILLVGAAVLFAAGSRKTGC